MSTRITDPEGILLSIDRILPNPWQTRRARAGDDEHVAGLAADIRARGLLQPPLGRTVLVREGEPTVPWEIRPLSEYSIMLEPKIFIQLAFGHNRFAAYRLLAEQYPDEHWDRIPIRIAQLDDHAMALAAWSENAARKDLSPLEAAQALQRLITDFGWTQEEAAEQTGLARATVANKIRLLRLPEALLHQLHAGEISERQAAAFLPALDLPEPTRQAAANTYGWKELQVAMENAKTRTSENLRQVVEYAIQAATVNLEQAKHSWDAFPLDAMVAGEGARAMQCLTCPDRRHNSNEDLGSCPYLDCYQAKQRAYQEHCLREAAESTGLPILLTAEYDRLTHGQYHFFSPWGNNERQVLEQARLSHCPGLHLIYRHTDNPDQAEKGEAYPLRVPGHPYAAYICVNRDNTRGECCHCIKAAEKEAAPAKKAADQQAQRATARRKAEAVELVAQALGEGRPGAWKAVLVALDWQESHNQREKDRCLADPDTVLQRIAARVLDHASIYWTSEEHAADSFARWQREVGLDLTAPDPTAALHRRWVRVRSWLDRLEKEAPNVEAVRGNLQNLIELSGEVEEARAGEEGAPPELAEVARSIEAAIDGLQLLLPVVQNCNGNGLNADELRDAHILLYVPAEDCNWKGAMERADARVIGYTRALVHVNAAHVTKGAYEKIERRARKLGLTN